MNTITTRYGLFIDEIRIKKKMTVKQLCEGICNERSYRRYLSGERTLPQEKVLQFCKNLGVSHNDFYYMFFNQDRGAMNVLGEMYYKVSYRLFDEYLALEKKLKNFQLRDSMDIRFYEYLKIRFLQEKKKIDDYSALAKYMEIIDYPACKDKSVFDYVDLITLLSISQAQTRKKDRSFDSLELLERILVDDSILYMTFGARYMLLTIYSAVTVALYRKKDYDKALEIANIGIKKSITSGQAFPLANMYFIRGAIYINRGMLDEAHIEAKKCLAAVSTVENHKLYANYVKLIEKDFGADIETIYKKFHDKYKNA